MSVSAWVEKAIACERSAQWSEARKAWDEAKVAARSVGVSRTRAECAGLKIGAVLKHTYYGEVRAECVFEAEGRYVYAGVAYPSLSAAARAASRDLGRRSKMVNGWLFWGIEKG